jgi:hypothetical protein
METGFDGEYYYVQLDKEDLDKLREMVLKKVRERTGTDKLFNTPTTTIIPRRDEAGKTENR